MVKFFKKAGVLLRRGITLLFDRDYDQFVEGDSSISDRTYEYSYVISRLAAQKPGKLLDVGVVSGMCIPTQTLCEMGFRVVGADLRKYPFRHPNYEHVLCDVVGSKLPYEEGHFDYACSISVIEHIGLSTNYKGQAENAEGDFIAVKEMARVLRKGGLLILTTPFAGKEMRKNEMMRSYNYERLECMLENAGLDAKEVKVVGLATNDDGRDFEEIPLSEARERQTNGKTTIMIALIKAVKR